MKIKVKCPAKINLTLKVFPRDEITGFHPIKSIMQAISLYDYLTIETTKTGVIEFFGNSNEISYDENNLIIKACSKFFDTAKIKNEGLKIELEKNIPVAAGLAGGSTDAVGMIFALNCIYKNVLSECDIFNILSSLGSDLNFCYKGGCALCEGKGDDMTAIPFMEFPISLVKPKNLKISTKDAYSEFDNLKEKSNLNNDLEFALLGLYPELQTLNRLGFQMSGSGPSFFIKEKTVGNKINKEDYLIFENLKTIPDGVTLL